MPSVDLNPMLYILPLDNFMPTFLNHVCTVSTTSGELKHIDSPDFHYELIETLNQMKPYNLFVAPRGFAKSTLISFTYVLYASLFGLTSYTLIVSDSYTKAAGFVDKIKREIESNDFLRDVFQITPAEAPWASGNIEFNVGWLPDRNRIRIVARGAGQSLRGFVEDTRPTLIVLDDIESERNADTAGKRLKIREWVFKQIIPALEPDVGKLIIVGTIINDDCLLVHMKEVAKGNPEMWSYKHYAALGEDNKSIWEARHSTASLLMKKDDYARAGMLHVFFMEYMNDPTANPDKMFDIKLLRWYNPFKLDLYKLRTYMAVDFGASAGPEAVASNRDYTVIVVVGVDPLGNIYIREYIRDRMLLSETINTLFMLSAKYHITKAAVESGGPQKMYYLELINAMNERGIHFSVEELNHKQSGGKNDKHARISLIQPRLNQGKLWVLPTMVELINEMDKYGVGGTHDDILDAVANAIIMLLKLGVLVGVDNVMDWRETSESMNRPKYYMP